MKTLIKFGQHFRVFQPSLDHSTGQTNISIITAKTACVSVPSISSFMWPHTHHINEFDFYGCWYGSQVCSNRIDEFLCVGWLRLYSRSLYWFGVCCAFCLPNICSLPLWFAHWHFQMWVVHEGCDWGERLTFCVSASAWQWLRSTDICESADWSTPKIFYYEKEKKITHYTFVSVAVICAHRMSDKNETEKDEW